MDSNTNNDFQSLLAPQQAVYPMKSRAISFALRIVVENHPLFRARVWVPCVLTQVLYSTVRSNWLPLACENSVARTNKNSPDAL